MTIKKARKILKLKKKDISDKDLNKLIEAFSVLADIFIEQHKSVFEYGN